MAVLVGSVIGSGIFRSPAGIARNVPVEEYYLLLWVLAGFIVLCGALAYSELSGMLPHTGGVFVYLREGYGPLAAFLFGWAELVVIRASALGAVSTVFAEYLLRSLGQPVFVASETGALTEKAPMVGYVAMAAIIVVATFNILGVRLGALVMKLTTGAKYGALVALVLAAFLIGANYAPPADAAVASVGNATSITAFGLAMISVLWVYDGWADVTFVSGEVERPGRNLPLALIGGTLAIVGIYLLVNFAYLHLLDIKEIAGSKLVAADAAYRMVGDTGIGLISIAVMISAFGTLNGSMMTGPRIFFAMADEGLFFKKIGAVHKRFQTPYVAISLAAGMAIVFVNVRTFEQLADTFVLAIWPFYAAGVGAVYMLRRKRPDMERPYRTFGYPVTPLLFIAAALFVFGNAVWEDLRHMTGAAENGSGALLVFAIILAGVPAYYLWRATRR